MDYGLKARERLITMDWMTEGNKTETMNESRPIVSIIIPVFNSAKYVERCVKSIEMQTFQEFEILLMCCAKDSNSIEKCLQLQKRDERIVIVSRFDKGLGDARNYALNIARCKYIAYVDADDYVEEDFLEQLIKPFEDKEVDITCCGVKKIDDKGNIVTTWIPGENGKTLVDARIFFNVIWYGTVWLKAFRKQWLVDNELFMFAGNHEDDAMHICLAGLVKCVYFIQKDLYCYNVGNEDSLMHNSANRIEFFDAYKFAYDYLKKKNLFDINRETLRERALFSIEKLLSEHGGVEGIEARSEEFIKEYYPETVLDGRIKLDSISLNTQKVIVFGAGADLELAIKEVGRDNIIKVIDNDNSKQGCDILGFTIERPEQILSERQKYLIVISSRKYFYEMANQLLDCNYKQFIRPYEYKILDYIGAREKRRIILFNTPNHNNIGDHAIAEAINNMMVSFGEFQIKEVTEYEIDYQLDNNQDLIKRVINKDDIIAVTGGGFLGTLWRQGGEEKVRRIAAIFSDNKIVIFPQTMYYEPDSIEKEIKTTREIYKKCKDLTIILREKKSYELAKRMYGDLANTELVPDSVLSMNNVTCSSEIDQNKCSVCFKTNKESILTDSEQETIIKKARELFSNVTKTSMYMDGEICQKTRINKIQEKMNELSSNKVVITDALHCMIFCAVTGTNCICIDSISGKTSGTYEWIEELPYIYLAKNVDDVEKILSVIVKKNEKNNYTFNYELYRKRIKDILSS